MKQLKNVKTVLLSAGVSTGAPRHLADAEILRRIRASPSAQVALSDVVNAGDNGPSARIVGWGTNPEGGFEAWLVTNYPYDDLQFIKD